MVCGHCWLVQSQRASVDVVHQKMNFCFCLSVSECDGRDEFCSVNISEHIQNATGKININAVNVCPNMFLVHDQRVIERQSLVSEPVYE